MPLRFALEMIWVLESVYEVSMIEILESISDLLLMPVLKYDQPSMLQQLVLSAQGNKFDLTDVLIAHSAKVNGCEIVITFDENAAKFKLFEFLK